MRSCRRLALTTGGHTGRSVVACGWPAVYPRRRSVTGRRGAGAVPESSVFGPHLSPHAGLYHSPYEVNAGEYPNALVAEGARESGPVVLVNTGCQRQESPVASEQGARRYGTSRTGRCQESSPSPTLSPCIRSATGPLARVERRGPVRKDICEQHRIVERRGGHRRISRGPDRDG
jgi:hypothetical protein